MLRLIAKALREAMDRLRPHDDALMIGRAPVRCIRATPSWILSMISQQQSDSREALSAQSATVAGDSRMGSVQEHRANVVIRSVVATGRADSRSWSATPGIRLQAPRAGEEGFWFAAWRCRFSTRARRYVSLARRRRDGVANQRVAAMARSAPTPRHAVKPARVGFAAGHGISKRIPRLSR